MQTTLDRRLQSDGFRSVVRSSSFRRIDGLGLDIRSSSFRRIDGIGLVVCQVELKWAVGVGWKKDIALNEIAA
jgi:hypothetical protein